MGLAASHSGYLSRLRKLKHPALIANGNDDIMIPTVNSIILFNAMPNAQLVLYPDSGHGALFEYSDLFVQQANLFLDHDNF
ncbi:hypothetical protein IVB18_50790 (plasmid) [Bradyrhizobium sp. 186]|uniref:alpha/beta fold hydrolase n=1 Tax=Bradyrhizobium sp. 186 TaxID=2782654 RepID=UPI002000FE95|nr:hypothetical protein [Bradyrhizobium sp. 186]UPK40905.1 hypothetical protein IVB18_50790 [Bradyrhizobium sp. 186]